MTNQLFPPERRPKVELIAPLASDWTGDSIKTHARRIGMGVDHTMTIPGYPTPSCLIHIKQTGEISQSVCDFRMLREGITPETFQHWAPEAYSRFSSTTFDPMSQLSPYFQHPSEFPSSALIW